MADLSNKLVLGTTLKKSVTYLYIFCSKIIMKYRIKTETEENNFLCVRFG